MLKTDEIREICEKHQLERSEVYNIRSQFAGMCLMSKEEEMKEAVMEGAKGGEESMDDNARSNEN